MVSALIVKLKHSMGFPHNEQVISYVIIVALADAYPVLSNFNRGAAIVQVIFIYLIQMRYVLRRSAIQIRALPP